MLIMNLVLLLLMLVMAAYDFALSNSVNSCKNKNVFEKMLLQDDFEKVKQKNTKKRKIK